MFDVDRSAARALMAARRFCVQGQVGPGEAPAHRLFESVSAEVKNAVVTPRSFDDYIVSGADAASLPPRCRNAQHSSARCLRVTPPEYAESDLLPISGLQHLAFCERGLGAGSD
jgi:hypothetical protein